MSSNQVKVRIEQLNKAIKAHEELIAGFESIVNKTKDKEEEIEQLKVQLEFLITEKSELS